MKSLPLGSISPNFADISSIPGGTTNRVSLAKNSLNSFEISNSNFQSNNGTLRY